MQNDNNNHNLRNRITSRDALCKPIMIDDATETETIYKNKYSQCKKKKLIHRAIQCKPTVKVGCCQFKVRMKHVGCQVDPVTVDAGCQYVIGDVGYEKNYIGQETVGYSNKDSANIVNIDFINETVHDNNKDLNEVDTVSSKSSKVIATNHHQQDLMNSTCDMPREDVLPARNEFSQSEPIMAHGYINQLNEIFKMSDFKTPIENKSLEQVASGIINLENKNSVDVIPNRESEELVHGYKEMLFVTDTTELNQPTEEQV